jgi:hypothetical protein
MIKQLDAKWFHFNAVKGYLSENDVTELMIKIQEYKG